MRQPIYKPAVAWILAVQAEGNVPLSAFTTNDWHSNTAPSVYIATPYPAHATKRYQRLDRLTIAYAVRWYAFMRRPDDTGCSFDHDHAARPQGGRNHVKTARPKI